MNEIFSIFNPDWWMDENNNALQMGDAILFLIFLLPIAYLFIYSLASLRKYKNPYPHANIQHRFLVVFTVLRDGKEVISSINTFLDTQTIRARNMTLQSLPPNYPRRILSHFFRCRSIL